MTFHVDRNTTLPFLKALYWDGEGFEVLDLYGWVYETIGTKSNGGPIYRLAGWVADKYIAAGRVADALWHSQTDGVSVWDWESEEPMKNVQPATLVEFVSRVRSMDKAIAEAHSIEISPANTRPI